MHEKSKFSCEKCHAAHRQCDRVLPRCSRCVKLGLECVYPPARGINQDDTSSTNTGVKKRVGRPRKPQAISDSSSSSGDQSPGSASPTQHVYVEATEAAAAATPSDTEQRRLLSELAISDSQTQLSRELASLSLIDNVYFKVLSLGFPMISQEDINAVLMSQFRPSSQTFDLHLSNGSSIRNYHVALVHSIEAICMQRLGFRSAGWSCFKQAENVVSSILTTHFRDGAGPGSRWYTQLQSRREDMRLIVLTIIVMARFLLGVGRAVADNRSLYVDYAMSYIEYKNPQEVSQASFSVKHAAGMLNRMKLSESFLGGNVFEVMTQRINASSSPVSTVPTNRYPDKIGSYMDPRQAMMLRMLMPLVTADTTYTNGVTTLFVLEQVKMTLMRGQFLIMTVGRINLHPDQQQLTTLQMDVQQRMALLGQSSTWINCLYLVLARTNASRLSEYEKYQVRCAIYNQLDMVIERCLPLISESNVRQLGYSEPDTSKAIATLLRYNLDRVIKYQNSLNPLEYPPLPQSIAQSIKLQFDVMLLFLERFDFVQQEYGELIQLAQQTLDLLNGNT